MSAILNEQTGRYEASIEGQTFEFELWPASQSLRTLVEISSIIGVPIAALRTASLSASGSAFADIGKHLMTHSDSGIKLVKKLTSVDGGVLCDHKPIKFDDFYRGKFGTMCHVARENFFLQYGSLTEAAAQMGLNLQAPATASVSPTDTTEASA